MTTYVQLTRMAPDALVDQARSLCAALAGEQAGGGELTTGCVPVGSPPGTAPTWWITSGPIQDTFASAMKDPALMHEYCRLLELPVTLEACEQLLGACVIDDRPGLIVLAELGLELAAPVED